MNRMFDDVLRGFDLAPFGPTSRSLGGLGWPRIDIDETDKEMRISAELPPGLDENGVLSISGEKKTESEDKARRFSERYYGRFERRISLQDIEEDKATAAFKNGVLTVSVPKSAEEECPPHRDKPQWLTLPTFGRSLSERPNHFRLYNSFGHHVQNPQKSIDGSPARCFFARL
jgi:HSP20 family protein